jgi:NAD(P)-dependent dehydrogenase (short-subunit alcohol dehydrogenase family)
VYIVTGSNTGVGKELAQILYSKNAKVYIAARSEEKANRAIAELRQAWPKSTGDLVFLHLDLADFNQIKSAAKQFAAKETKLHVLFNNAAVQALGDSEGQTKTAQGHELHLGVNVLGVFLLTRLLTPILAATAKAEPAGTVRVVWVSSMGTEAVGEKGRGISEDYLSYWPSLMPLERYGVSKAGAWLHGAEFARRHAADGIVSVPCNPGHLRSDLYRESGWLFKAAISPVLYPPKFGAYTELFCGLSPAITAGDSGKWGELFPVSVSLFSEMRKTNCGASVIPWGRLYPIRKDLQDATKTEAEGGNDHARKFWEWSEEQTREYC